MAQHCFTHPQVVDYLHQLLISLDSQGLDCVDVILQATARAAVTIPSLSCFNVNRAMITNLKASLQLIVLHERQSGAYHALLGSVAGRTVDTKDLCRILSIDPRTANKTLAKLQHRNDHFQQTGKYLPIVKKCVIKRTRIPAALFQRIEAFFVDNCSPSADKSKVKKRKIAPGKYEQKAIMYRTTTMPRLLAKYRVRS